MISEESIKIVPHWELVQRGAYIDICCSECGYTRVKEYAYNYKVRQIDKGEIDQFFENSNMYFCENCGRKMTVLGQEVSNERKDS